MDGRSCWRIERGLPLGGGEGVAVIGEVVVEIGGADVEVHQGAEGGVHRERRRGGKQEVKTGGAAPGANDLTNAFPIARFLFLRKFA